MEHSTKECIKKYTNFGIELIVYNGVADTYLECLQAKRMGIFGLQSVWVTNEEWLSN